MGESGCGKTTVAYAITQLLPSNARITSGEILYKGRNLLSETLRDDGTLDVYEDAIRRIRWKEISMIFQGAMNAFNPVKTVGDQIVEAIKVHEDLDKHQARAKALRNFSRVGIPTDRFDDYPHEFSGGMKQRAMIAMALVLGPSLVIADEPTTALDVIMQDRILAEIKRLQRDLGMAMIIISHDVSVVAEVSDRIAIMYAGKLTEVGSIKDVFYHPAHPYTEGLLGSFPNLRGVKRRLLSIPGNPPDLTNPPAGCRFNPRCVYAQEVCRVQVPDLLPVVPGQQAACHFSKELHGQLRGVK